MKVYSIFLVLFSVSMANSYVHNVNCKFVNFLLYTCQIDSQTIYNDETLALNFTGEHLSDKGNADVQRIQIFNSNIRLIHPQFFTTFNNIYDVTIYKGVSQIQPFAFMNASSLTFISITFSVDLKHLEAHAFTGARKLLQLNLENNNIETINEDAFNGAGSLTTLVLKGNKIGQLSPRTFTNLYLLVGLNLNDNRIEFLDGGLFMNNTNLAEVQLNNNRINAIERNLLDGFVGFKTFSVKDNVCVDNSWDSYVNNNIGIIRNGLKTCFDNADQKANSDVKIFNLEVHGSFSLKFTNGSVLVQGWSEWECLKMILTC